jgi:hypothetical protein
MPSCLPTPAHFVCPACNFKSSEPQNPQKAQKAQKAQKNQNSLSRALSIQKTL